MSGANESPTERSHIEMSPEVAIEIIDLAVALLKQPGDVLDTLLEIAQKTNQAYYDQAGKPLDQFLIMPEDEV